MIRLFRRALDAAGYTDSAASAEAVRECFLDYVDAGTWADLDAEDVDDIGPESMARALLRL